MAREGYVDFNRYSGLRSAYESKYPTPSGVAGGDNGGGDFTPGLYASQLSELLGLSPEEVALYTQQLGKGTAQRDEATIAALAGQFAPMDFSRVAGQAGQAEAALERQMAGDLQRYGISSLDQVGVVKTSLGDTVFIDKKTGKALPTTFGSDMSGGGGKRFSLTADEKGVIGVKPEWRDTTDADPGWALPLAVVGGGMALDQLLYGSVGGGMAAAGGAGAAAPGAAAPGLVAPGAEGATGLSSLPQAGTWSHVGAAAPTQGVWTSPAALSGVTGVTEAGGLTLADTLANTYARDLAMQGVLPGEGLTSVGGPDPLTGTTTPGNPSLPKAPGGIDPNLAKLLGLGQQPQMSGVGGLPRGPGAFQYADTPNTGRQIVSLSQILGR